MDDFSALTEMMQAERLRQLALVALEEWGFEDASLDLVKIRENAVYKADRLNGDCYIVRVHRAGYHSDVELMSEFQWMQALNKSGIPTPEVIPAKDGSLFKWARIDSVPEHRQVDVLELIVGEPLGTIEEGIDGDVASLAETFEYVGATAARLHNQSESWTLPTGFARGAFDLDGLTGDNPHWGEFRNCGFLTSEQRATVQAASQKLRADLYEFGTAPDRFGLIHADLLPENFLVGSHETKLIDFDDAAFGWHMFDLATPLFFQLGEPHFETILEALIKGYRQHRDLPDEHLAMLPAFLLARGTTYLGWLHTRPESDTAKELGPIVAEGVYELAQSYLQQDSSGEHSQ